MFEEAKSSNILRFSRIYTNTGMFELRFDNNYDLFSNHSEWIFSNNPFRWYDLCTVCGGIYIEYTV